MRRTANDVVEDLRAERERPRPFLRRNFLYSGRFPAESVHADRLQVRRILSQPQFEVPVWLSMSIESLNSARKCGTCMMPLLCGASDRKYGSS